jgi:hypothetical protein
MKYTCHVPTEQYGFIAVELDGEPHEAVEAYRSVKAEWGRATGAGLPPRDFTRFIDSYLATAHAPPDGLEQWELMDDRQKHVVNEIKKALKRIHKEPNGTRERVQEPVTDI